MTAVRPIPLLALFTAITLTGCGHDATATAPAAEAHHAAPTNPAVSTAAPQTALPSDFAASDTAPPPLDDAGPTTVPLQSARPDPTSGGQARARATAFLRAFARTDLNQETWWRGVEGYFSPAASAIYGATDVANVPVHHVTEGSAKLLPETTKYRAEVAVDTDIGTYTVVLIRAESTWLVERAVPPK